MSSSLLPDGEHGVEGLAKAHTPGARQFPIGEQIATRACCAANIGRRLTGAIWTQKASKPLDNRGVIA
jgi:hypothetical protein